MSRIFQKNNLCILMLVYASLACSTSANKTADEIINVPLNQKPKLSEFIDNIEYIALPAEMQYGFIDRVIVTADYFIFADYDQAMQVYVLDKSFQVVSIISNYGEGPGEYLWIEGINFNEQRNTVELLTNKDLIRYSIEGDFIESKRLPAIFGNLVSISNDEYVVYSKDVKKGTTSSDQLNSVYLYIWNTESNLLAPLVFDYKEDVIGSTMDRDNMFRYDNEVYATYIYMDTIFRYNFLDKKIHKTYVNLEGQNLPIELIYGIQPSQLLNREDVQEKYAVHYPGLMVNDHYFIDKFAKYNMINFYIINKNTSRIISGREVHNDLDNGLEYFNPRFLDKNDHLYTIHQYEELWEHAENNKSITSDFNTFVNGLDPQTGFVLIKHHLKNF